MSPTFPPPVLDHVLSQDVLSAGDLARCCLVTRDWLDPARRTLYHSVTVEIVSTNRDIEELQQTVTSARRLATFRENPAVAQLVRRVAVREVDEGDDISLAPEVQCGDVHLALLLRASRNVRWVDVSETWDEIDYTATLLASALPFTHLFLNSSTRWRDLLPSMPHVRHLLVTVTEGSAPPPSTFVSPSLRSLEFVCHRPDAPAPFSSTFAALCPNSNNWLQRLHIPADVLLFPAFHLTAFPSLRYLCVRINLQSNPEAVLTQLCPSLAALSLHSLGLVGFCWARDEYRDLRRGRLAASFPPSLRHLVLGSGFGYAEVILILMVAARAGLKRLAWFPPQGAESSASGPSLEVQGLEGISAALGVTFLEFGQSVNLSDVV